MKKKEMVKGSRGWGSWTAVEEAVGLQLEADALQIARWLTLVHTHLGSGFSSFRSVSVPLGPVCVSSSFTWVRSQLYINTIQGQLYRDLLQYQKF